MSSDLGVQWQEVIVSALANRRGLKEPDNSCRLTGAVTLVVFSNATHSWMRQGFQTSLTSELDREFDLLVQLCSEWSRPTRRSRPARR
jgi:hypothetical protein